MKNFTLVFIFLLVVFSASGQNIEWAKMLSSPFQAGVSCVVTDDLNTIWLFYDIYDSTNFRTQSLLKKFDQSGNLQSNDTLPITLGIYFVQKSDHSTFYIWGKSNDSTIQLSGHHAYGNFIAEMDFNNNWINVSRNLGRFGQVNDFKFDEAGNLYVAETHSTVPHASSAFYKFDKNGNLVYSTASSIPTNSSGFSIQPLSNGNCYDFIRGDGINSFEERDSIGNVLWNINSPEIRNMATDTFNNLYIMGYFTRSIQFGSIILTDSINTRNIFIAKMDSQHNFEWVNKISSTGSIFGGNLTCDPVNRRLYLEGNYSDSIYFYGNGFPSYGSSIFSHAMYIASFDLNGNMPWITTVTSSNSVVPYSLATNQLGQIFISGAFVDTLFVDSFLVSVTTGKSDIYLMKIADTTNSIENITVKNSLLVYPNPADKDFTIKFSDTKYTNVQLFNSTGAIVKLFSNQLNGMQISVEDLSNGIYFLREISEDNNPVFTKIIVAHSR